jgi:hypothetical protein
VIAVFTKFDQFKRDIEMKLEDQDRERERANPDIEMKLEDQAREHANLDNEVETVFSTEYVAHLGGSTLFVCLESKFL